MFIVWKFKKMTQEGINLAMTRGEKWRGTREQYGLGDLS